LAESAEQTKGEQVLRATAKCSVALGKLVKSHWILTGVIVLWSAAIGLGARELLRYANTPGRLAAPPQHWPNGSSLHPPAGPIVLVFAHPQCPCSRATIDELAIVMARARGKATAVVFFIAPGSQPLEWVHSDLWRDAQAIPGVDPVEDAEGREARRFGVSTSGQTLLYDGGHNLQFNGGITASRGHSGGNYGRDAVITILEFGTAQRHTTPVFGCSLFGEEPSLQ
jgi:hypothetical protein